MDKTKLSDVKIASSCDTPEWTTLHNLRYFHTWILQYVETWHTAQSRSADQGAGEKKNMRLKVQDKFV